MRISDWSSDVCSSDLKPRKVRPPRCVIHLETGNPHNILETARRLCIWDNPPLAIIIAKLPRNGFTPPRDNPEILMAIDLNGLSAKELDSLITKAKAGKTTLKKRKPVATVRRRLGERKSKRLTSRHKCASRMPSSAGK